MDDSITKQIYDVGARAKQAALILAVAPSQQKDEALRNAAAALRRRADDIISANELDMASARESGVTGAFLDRLALDGGRIESMAAGLEAIAAQDDPVGRILAQWQVQSNGLRIKRVAVPLGVIGAIYESRPNVTADAGALCLKSGNAAILRGGSESFNSSGVILDCLREGLAQSGLPEDAVSRIPTKSRDAVGVMLGMYEHIDVIIPRGGKGLIKRVMEQSKIPTFQHLDGNCHIYVHRDADMDKAVEVVLNAKMRRTGICGAAESLLVDREIAARFVPAIADALMAQGCDIVADDEARAIDGRLLPAGEDDWAAEYLDAKISLHIVGNVHEATAHINRYGSHHTDAIITADAGAAAYFMEHVDSAIVMHNSSTQFADGGEFGMGAEIGIATGRLHARGPVGAEQLTTFKYQVEGDYSLRG